MDPDLTTGDTIKVPVSLKLFFDINERYIPRINAMYNTGFLHYFFGEALDTDAVRATICSSLNNCAEEGIGDGAALDCPAQLAALPNIDVDGYFDGNSQGCRVLHNFLTRLNPQGHCAHISLTPLRDQLGLIKCQTSERLQVSDLFSAEEIVNFDEFAMRNGVDPVAGFKVIES